MVMGSHGKVMEFYMGEGVRTLLEISKFFFCLLMAK
jgi:hypothetical protein